ncbi:MAG: ubiquinol-cytochrome C reductase [Henriciella sp.]|jgi:predicted RNA-binding protein with PUA-like domain|uniref:EVE domain-containing protein n=1 Tax=Henriciella sp. TaxID=1968823 RepID=UPI000C0DDA1B|nr:EVE domain-containing protein [Henriciella sp.]MAN73398.1 ubiquinol-cytochrome C reductase [Henriciella sp.]MBF33565.1 ubiquinol-cytochrome C reductase [Hyphomonadaceae bacterium]MBK76328.1 ubiquinol-cytochrome C reductase [Henriciella sp.]PHR76895.1 MAG: ubiquinol-cytochrome C reductase [Henriciella sp.]|tara:strand:+ start:752 stop:1189 length:438 start_codon:yes stop_codon:yes gene_type:complete
MAYWLFKSEPFKWGWDDQTKAGEKGTQWTGVRNYQARNFMRDMKVGDKGFFYHSNKGLEVVGIVEVSAESYQDKTTDDERWDAVDLVAVCDMPEPVTLKAVKANEALEDMALVTSFRLSVQPVKEDEWMEVCRMGGLNGKTLKPL